MSEKIIITMQGMMEQMNVSDKTIHKMIEEGDLPDFTYGSKWSRKKGWHTAVLERHAMEKYEKSNSFKNIRDSRKVTTKNMTIMSLSRSDRTMTKKNADFDNRNSIQQKLGSKKVAKSMRTSTVKSRIAAGFSNMPT